MDRVRIDPQQLPMLVRTLPLIGAAGVALWALEGPGLWLGWWDMLGLPLMSGTVLAAGLAMALRPAWADAAAVAAMAAASLYLQGVLFINLFQPRPEYVYSLLTIAQFLPLFYMMAFAGLRSGAATVCWLHCGVMEAQLVFSIAMPHPAESPLLQHGKAALLLAQPLFIIALTVIARLRRRLAREQRDSYRSKERLLAMMSHDIRSPLQTMLSSIDLLETKAQDGASRRAVQRLGSVAGQLDRHLRDLLDFARLDNPDLAIERRPYDLRAVVQSVVDAHVDDADGRGLSLVSRCMPPMLAGATPDLPWPAVGDAVRVRQVLDNLVGNAVKYTEEGQVTVDLRCGDGPGWARIVVEDTGQGIAPEALPHVFEPFRRAGDGVPGSTSPEGSGLGLAIAARLAGRLGGRIEVDSLVGRGSRFCLLLPLAQPVD